MKTRGYSIWMYTAIAMAMIFMASCGNSKKREERRAEKRASEQVVPAGAVVESETVVVEVDSIVQDSAAMKKNMVTPRKTK